MITQNDIDTFNGYKQMILDEAWHVLGEIYSIHPTYRFIEFKNYSDAEIVGNSVRFVDTYGDRELDIALHDILAPSKLYQHVREQKVFDDAYLESLKDYAYYS